MTSAPIPRPASSKSPRSSPDPGAGRAEVLLVSMPFGPLYAPSIGLSLLRARLEGIAKTQIRYFTLDFAALLGPSLYHWIGSGGPSTLALLGEWLFSHDLFPNRPGNDREFLERFVRGTEHVDPPTDSTVEAILLARKDIGTFLDQCLEEVLERRPRIVGLTSVFQQHVASLALARRLGEAAPEIFVVLGGANCEGPMGWETARRFPFVDAVVSGEGEIVFPDMVARVMAGDPVPELRGVYTRETEPSRSDPLVYPNAVGPADLDTLPFPDYRDFFRQWEAAGLETQIVPEVLFETSRGCWWGERQHCTFCGLNGSAMGFRSKSAQRAMDELLHLADLYSGCSIQVVDNILDVKYFQSFIKDLAAKRLDLDLFYEVKANLRRDQVELLSRSGIKRIQPGIESFSDDVLKLMRKGVSALQNIQLLKWCKEYGVKPFWNLIWGFPGERAEDYAEMAELIPLLSHLPSPQKTVFDNSQIRLDRFSPNFTQSDELGFAGVSPAPAYGFIYPFNSDSVANLAYYFTYEYKDGRDVDAYTRPVREALERWRQDYPRSELVSLERPDRVVIMDTRPVAATRLRILDGLEAALFRACDGARSLAGLRQLAERHDGVARTEEEILSLLKPLLDDGQMVRRRGHVLGLAVRQKMSGGSSVAP